MLSIIIVEHFPIQSTHLYLLKITGQSVFIEEIFSVHCNQSTHRSGSITKSSLVYVVNHRSQGLINRTMNAIIVGIAYASTWHRPKYGTTTRIGYYLYKQKLFSSDFIFRKYNLQTWNQRTHANTLTNAIYCMHHKGADGLQFLNAMFEL